MQDIEFFVLLLENWFEFTLINVFCFFLLFFAFRKVLVGGVFDPLFLVFVVGFSTNYAVVLFLYISGYISFELFSMLALYALFFTMGVVYFSKVESVVTYSILVPTPVNTIDNPLY